MRRAAHHELKHIEENLIHATREVPMNIVHERCADLGG